MKIQFITAFLGMIVSATAFAHTGEALLKRNDRIHTGENLGAPLNGACAAKIDAKNKTITVKFVNEKLNEGPSFLTITRRFDSTMVKPLGSSYYDEQMMIAGDLNIFFSKEGDLVGVFPAAKSHLGPNTCSFW